MFFSDHFILFCPIFSATTPIKPVSESKTAPQISAPGFSMKPQMSQQSTAQFGAAQSPAKIASNFPPSAAVTPGGMNMNQVPTAQQPGETPTGVSGPKGMREKIFIR